MRSFIVGLLLLACGLLSSAAARAQAPACISESDWSVCYSMTSTDGLRVYAGFYRDVKVFDNATLPEIDVHYQRFTFSDALGPYAIPPAGPTEKIALDEGFELRQVFMITGWPACGTYRYVQVWRFFADGRFEPRLVIQGPGEEGPHTYVTYWRLDLDIAGAAGDRYRQWTSDWEEQTLEGKYPYAAPSSPEGYEWDHFDGPYHQLVVPAAGDNATWWVLRYQPDEGETDLPVQQPSEFPDLWVNGESIDATDQVVWYASQQDKLSNCDTTADLETGSTLYAAGYAEPATPTVSPTPELTPTVTPERSLIEGRVRLQGRTSHEGAVVALDAAPVAATQPDGSFSVSGVAAGQHDIRVDMPLYLCAARPVTTSTGETTHLPDLELRGGDADLNGLINVFDLVIIGANFGTQPVPASLPGDWRADINADGEVNVFDLVMAAGNYRRSCPTEWAGE